MGLVTSVNNITNELSEQKKQKEAEKLEKKKQQQKKELLQKYKKDLENFLMCEFTLYFESAGTSYLYEFYDKNRKKQILDNFFDTIKEEKTNKQKKEFKYNGVVTSDNSIKCTRPPDNNISFEYIYIPFKKELTEHFYNIYDKILKKTYKEQEQQEQYNLITEAEILKEQQEKEFEAKQKEEKLTKIIIAICLIPLAFVFFPLVFIIAILLSSVKNQK